MRKTIEVVKCDVCGISNEATEIMQVKYPVIFTTDQTEGRPTKPYVSMELIDLCDSCAKAVLKLEGQGAQGHNEYRFR